MSVLTFKDLQDKVLAFVDEAGSTGTTRTNVKYALNQAQNQRLTESNWPFMIWVQPESFTLVPGVQQYSLHSEFLRPISFYNRTAGAFLEEVPLRNFQELALTAVGQKNFVLWGEAAVQTQPTAASALTLVSTNAGDTGAAYGITVFGDTANGVTSETLVPSGTAPVTGAIAFTKVLSVTKAAAWAGMLTLSAGATTILTLFASEFGRLYPQIYFPLAPNSNDVIEYRFYRKPLPMVNDNDVPLIRYPFSEILAWDALKSLYSYDGQLDTGRMQLIHENQEHLDLAMRQAFMENQTINAQPRRIRYTGDD